MQATLTIVAGLCLLVVSMAVLRWAPMWVWFPLGLLWVVIVAKVRWIAEADLFYGYGGGD